MSDKKPVRRAKGRRCKTTGCSTILSVYNRKSVCAICERAEKARRYADA